MWWLHHQIGWDCNISLDITSCARLGTLPIQSEQKFHHIQTWKKSFIQEICCDDQSVLVFLQSKNSVAVRMWDWRTLCTVEGVQMGVATGREQQQVLTVWSSIPASVFILTGNEIRMWRDSPTGGCVLPLFTVVKQRKQPNVHQQLEEDSVVHTHYRVLCSLPFAVAWMKLEDTVLRETSQSQKNKCRLFSVKSESMAVILTEANTQNWLPGSRPWKNEERLVTGYTVSVTQMKKLSGTVYNIILYSSSLDWE